MQSVCSLWWVTFVHLSHICALSHAAVLAFIMLKWHSHQTESSFWISAIVQIIHSVVKIGKHIVEKICCCGKKKKWREFTVYFSHFFFEQQLSPRWDAWPYYNSTNVSILLAHSHDSRGSSIQIIKLCVNLLKDQRPKKATAITLVSLSLLDPQGGMTTQVTLHIASIESAIQVYSVSCHSLEKNKQKTTKQPYAWFICFWI